MSYPDRYERLSKAVEGLPLAGDFPLLKGVALTPAVFERLKNAINFYIWDNLCTWDGEKAPPLTENMVNSYEDLVRGLPNRTPNGIVLPKRQTYASYNVVHKVVSGILASHGLPRHFQQMMPVNIRVVDGQDREADKRPTSPTKPHVEMWAGFPSNAVVVLFPVFGDARKVGVKFFEPAEFPAEYQRPLESMDLGLPLMENVTQYEAHFDPGAFLIHHTFKESTSLRLSIDFMCIFKDVVASDANTEMHRKVDMLAPGDWSAIGRERMWYAPPELQAYVPQDTVHVHPANLKLVAMG
jgi:hypothetical protein